MRLMPEAWLKQIPAGLSLRVSGRNDLVDAWGGSFFPEGVVKAEQTHGSKIAVVGKTQRGQTVGQVDGLLTLSRDVWLAVRVADCIPVFLFSRDLKVIGIAHLGWRGLVGGLVRTWLAKAREAAQLPVNEFYFIFGPSIGGCCYQVDSHRARRFQVRYQDYPGLVVTNAQHKKLDLRLAGWLELRNEGVESSRVWAPAVCTACQSDRYYSYRGSQGQLDGHNLGYIGKMSRGEVQ